MLDDSNYLWKPCVSRLRNSERILNLRQWMNLMVFPLFTVILAGLVGHFPQLCMIQITANNLNVLAFINKNNQNRDERNTLGVSSKSRWLGKRGEHLGCACPAADPWWVDSAVIHGTKQLWPPIPALGVTKEALAKYRDEPMRAMKTFLTTAERRTPRWALMFSNCTGTKNWRIWVSSTTYSLCCRK